MIDELRSQQAARSSCATRTSRSGAVDAQPDGYPDEIDYDFGLTVEAQVTADPERPGRLDVRSAAGRPPGRDRHEVRRPGARQRR